MPSPKQYADALASSSWADRALPMKGRATFLPYQDTLPGSVMNKRSLALPGIVAGAINAFTAPGRAYRGSDPTFNSQEEALDFALNMMGGGMGASKIAPAPAGSVGMFAGERAKTADKQALKVAKDMKAAGVPDEQIHAKTKWTFAFADGKPRFEIDDSAAKGQFTHLPPSTDRLAEQAISHPRLYREYPELSQLNQLGLKEAKESGSFSPTFTNDEYTGGSILAKAPNETGIKSVGLHELQHAIQQREGFARGGNPEMFYASRGTISGDALTPEAQNIFNSALVGKSSAIPSDELSFRQSAATREAYRRLAGEAEARLTQSRMNMTPAERAASYPPSMFDVPVKDQIVRYGDNVGGAMMQRPKQ